MVEDFAECDDDSASPRDDDLASQINDIVENLEERSDQVTIASGTVIGSRSKDDRGAGNNDHMTENAESSVSPGELEPLEEEDSDDDSPDEMESPEPLEEIKTKR